MASQRKPALGGKGSAHVEKARHDQPFSFLKPTCITTCTSLRGPKPIAVMRYILGVFDGVLPRLLVRA